MAHIRNERGNSYTVERIMPRPWDMNISVQVLTSNQDQMYQLQEQIMAIFVPQIEIQNSDNPLDWTALTIMKLEDVEFNSRTIPVGSFIRSIEYHYFQFYDSYLDFAASKGQTTENHRTDYHQHL